MLYLKQNLSIWERIIRLFSAIIGLVIMYFIHTTNLQIILFIIIVILTFTALIGFCPLRTIIKYLSINY